MPSTRSHARAALWVIQTVLAALFLFAGGFKLASPMATLAAQAHLPGPFMRFIGVCEVAGALGLLLPGLFRVRVGLTALAAAGLAVIMSGATVLTAARMGPAPALFPLVVGVLTGITVAQMMDFFRRRLSLEGRPVRLKQVLGSLNSRPALICAFLALLEMVRLQAILLRQDRVFSDIVVKKNTMFDTVFAEGGGPAMRDDWK